MPLWPAGGTTAFQWKGTLRKNCMIKCRSLELPVEKEESIRERLAKNESCIIVPPQDISIGSLLSLAT